MFRYAFLFLTTFAFPLLAQEEVAPPRDQGLWQTFLLFGLAIAFFYLILWRPEQKRRKELERQRESIKKGDKVTAMGIIGKVVKVGEHTVILSMYDGSKIEFIKAAITDVISGDEAPEEKESS